MIKCNSRFNYNERNDELKYAFCKNTEKCPTVRECRTHLESIDKKNLFDKKLFSYYEDIDYYMSNIEDLSNCSLVNLVTTYENTVNAHKIPKVYEGMSLPNFDPNIWVSVRNLTDSVYIMGPVGTGKTTLAWSIMKYRWFKQIYNRLQGERRTPKYSFEFINVNDMFIQMKGSFNLVKPKACFENESKYIEYLKTKENNSESFFVKRISELDDLILDDLGNENSTEWTRSVLKSIVNYRWEKGLWTCFTSNYRISHISQNMDQAMASRITGMCKTLELKGKDRRMS